MEKEKENIYLNPVLSYSCLLRFPIWPFVVFCRCTENIVMCLWGKSKGENTPGDTDSYLRRDHLAQGRVPKLVSCHKTKVCSKQTRDHLLAEPLAWGKGLLPAQAFRKDANSDTLLHFEVRTSRF